MRLFFGLLLLLGSVHCLTQAELDAFTPRDPDYVDINTGLKSIIYAKNHTDETHVIFTNGIPSHETWLFPNGSGNPNELEENNITLYIPKNPTFRKDGPLKCLPLGFLGIATSGVAIDSWYPAVEGCPMVSDFEELDICEGHPSPDGQYHYHHYSPCVQMPTCGQPSTIWGVAIDGFPIYGPWDETGTQLTKQDLDECGGKETSEGYRYYMTVDAPYTLGCIKGEILAEIGTKAEDTEEFICACPFDDSMFIKTKPGDDQMRTKIAETCVFEGVSGPYANCTDIIDESYDIGYKWIQEEQVITLAPCCPEGSDCGMSCKTYDGIKEECNQEERKVMVMTRVESGSSVAQPCLFLFLLSSWLVMVFGK